MQTHLDDVSRTYMAEVEEIKEAQRHKCDEHKILIFEDRVVYVHRYNNDGYYTEHVEIKYCPHCGEKLKWKEPIKRDIYVYLYNEAASSGTTCFQVSTHRLSDSVAAKRVTFIEGQFDD